nr:glycine-rich cell wall structural protein 1.0-like [Aegilops tauschii subsp. strangulata]
MAPWNANLDRASRWRPWGGGGRAGCGTMGEGGGDEGARGRVPCMTGIGGARLGRRAGGGRGGSTGDELLGGGQQPTSFAGIRPRGGREDGRMLGHLPGGERHVSLGGERSRVTAGGRLACVFQGNSPPARGRGSRGLSAHDRTARRAHHVGNHQ